MSTCTDLTGLDSFLDAVRLNCHISDARHARDMTMCNYLLEMRELYRWERGVPYGIQPPRSDVGAWLAERESRWEELEDADYASLSHEDSSYGPFEIDTINTWLNRQNLCYGAGIGRFGKPHFFVGELFLRERREGLHILVCDREYARDLSTVPAALQGESIIIRRESVRRYLWERIEYWGTRDRSRAMRSVFEHYDIDRDRVAAVNRMLDDETESLILHELGEHLVGVQLGSTWLDMLAVCSSKRAEIVMRAVRDLWADSVSTLPTLLNRNSITSLHLWFANFSGMRLALFPALMSAYQTWERTGDLGELRDLIDSSAEHWRETALKLLSLFEEKKALAFEEIELIETLQMESLSDS
jgi:hypothetical protein